MLSWYFFSALSFQENMPLLFFVPFFLVFIQCILNPLPGLLKERMCFMLFFFLPSLIRFCFYIENDELKFLLLSLILFLLALLSKPAAIVLPALLIGIGTFYKKVIDKKILLSTIPFWAACRWLCIFNL